MIPGATVQVTPKQEEKGMKAWFLILPPYVVSCDPETTATQTA